MKDYAYGVLAVVVMLAILPAEATAKTRIQAVRKSDRVDVTVDGRLFTSYKFSQEQKYPYFWPVNGPTSGQSVTTETSQPYPHHHSLFFGCDRVNGGNYWQDSNERGQILSQGPTIHAEDGQYVLFSDRCLWKRPDHEPVFEDQRYILIHAPNERLRVIDITIRLKALTDVEILNTNHALFSARMVPELSVQAGGTLINAQGQTGEKGTFGQPSPWADYSGTRDGRTEGLAILESPSNPWYPCRWFTRDYGFFSPTPMQWLEGGKLQIPAGETLLLTYRVLVHAGKADHADIAGQFSRYADLFADGKMPGGVQAFAAGERKALASWLESSRAR